MQHLSWESFRPHASTWSLLYSQEHTKLLLAALVGQQHPPYGLLIHQWREIEGLPLDPQLPGSAQWCRGPPKSSSASLILRRAAVFWMAGRAEINQWIKGLCPSTINKVHHEWRLWKATGEAEVWGEHYPHPPQNGISSSATMLAADAHVHYCCISLVLWNF
jgi:hypothetical protein